MLVNFTDNMFGRRTIN